MKLTTVPVLVVLLQSTAISDCDLPSILSKEKPNAEWILQGDEYPGLKWLDKTQAKPTSKEIESAISACNEKKITDARAKLQAQIDLNTKTKSASERIDALIAYLGLTK